MKLNYNSLSNQYKPTKIKILLIGEAPPPNGKTYFYKVPDNYSPKKTIEGDYSLSATIFNHYFGRRPNDRHEYEDFLNLLKRDGIFLIDMYKYPEDFRGNKELRRKLFTDINIEKLLIEIKSLKNEESFKIIFLLARNYLKCQLDILRERFPTADLIRWKEFRMNTSEKIV